MTNAPPIHLDSEDDGCRNKRKLLAKRKEKAGIARGAAQFSA